MHFGRSKKGENIFRLFHVLAKIFFLTREAEQDYHRQKVNI